MSLRSGKYYNSDISNANNSYEIVLQLYRKMAKKKIIYSQTNQVNLMLLASFNKDFFFLITQNYSVYHDIF